MDLRSIFLRAFAALCLGAICFALSTKANAQYFRFGQNRVQHTSHDWQFVQSENFDVFFYGDTVDLARYTAVAAEASYLELTQLLVHRNSDRIPVVVYRGDNDFAATNVVGLPADAVGIGGVTELFKNRIALPFTGDYRQYTNVLRHEIVHAVVNDMLYGDSYQALLSSRAQRDLPEWVTEGLAEYASVGWSSDADSYMRHLVVDGRLRSVSASTGYRAYRTGQSFWDYLAAQYGLQKIPEIIHGLESGASPDEVLLASTGLGIREQSDRWIRYLKEIHFPEVNARESLDEIAIPLATRRHGLYNTSPSLNANGDRLAFVTATETRFDVVVMATSDGSTTSRPIRGQAARTFKQLRVLTPAVSWSPTGEWLAVGVRNGANDAVAISNAQTGYSRHLNVSEAYQIVSLDWSPVDDRIAIEIVIDEQSDIVVLDVESGELTRLTNDLYSDHEPSWSADGRLIVFHSDRHAAVEDPGILASTGSEVFMMDVNDRSITRLTFSEGWDSRSPELSGDNLYFLSDRNGIFNLYRKSLDGSNETAVTDLAVGLDQFDLSADGSRAAVTSLKEGTRSIYLINGVDTRYGSPQPAPSLWAVRRDGTGHARAPVLASVHESHRKANPFIRDAESPGSELTGEVRPTRALLASNVLGRSTPFRPGGRSSGNDAMDGDTTARVQVQLSDIGTNGHEGHQETLANGFASVGLEPADRYASDGRLKPRKYRLRFSPDLVYGTAGYDVLFGVQGVTQIVFSDLLGNHRVLVATNLLIDLRNSDYVVSYEYLPRRVNYGLMGFHTSRLLRDLSRATPTYYRYRQYGVRLTSSLPIDRYRRVDADVAVVGVSQADITTASVDPVTRAAIYPSLAYTVDRSGPSAGYPRTGHRFGVSLSGSPGFLSRQIEFATIVIEGRAYASSKKVTGALRLSAGASVGKSKQLFFTSGVQNWVNRRFDEGNGFPIEDVADFVLVTALTPMRGYSINHRNGSLFAILNAEMRMPLRTGDRTRGPFRRLNGVGFVDVGALGGGRSADTSFNFLRTDASGSRVLDDLLVGAGFGIRSSIFGIPARIDAAWPFDGRTIGRRQLYFSLGQDF